MDPTGVSVALIGRNSKCKALFLKAASSSEQPVSDATTQIDVWWTPSYVPGLTEADIVQAPVHGFSPSGERLLQAQLRHVSVAEIVEMKAKEGGGSGGGGRYHSHPALLLLVSADMMFHNGRPRPGRGAVNLVKAAVSRARERLGSSEAPIAVAVSVDVQEEGGKGQQISSSSSVKALLSSVKDEMGADGVAVIAVSPRTELWLREQEREGGRVSYRRGDSQFRVRPAFEQLMDESDIARARAAFDACGGTGIIAAVSAAIALTPPALIFPVADFLTLQSSGWSGDGAPAAPLRTCRPMLASSSARDVFNVEKEEGILNGDLVNAEVVAARAGSTPPASPASIELDAPIGKGAWFLRLETNRKAAKVWTAGIAGTPGGKAGKPLASVQFGDLRSKERRRGRS